MIVAKRRAHLAGGEVEDASAAIVVDVRALGALDEERREVADLADHVALDGILQPPPALLPAAFRARRPMNRHGRPPFYDIMLTPAGDRPSGPRERSHRPQPD
jgi:hypothetical protein